MSWERNNLDDGRGDGGPVFLEGRESVRWDLVEGSVFRVQGLVLKVWGLRFRV